VRLSSTLHFIISLLAALTIGGVANATDPYTLITPTGNSTTDTAAMNSALSSCATRAIFITPGSLSITGSIDLTTHPGCAIVGGQVGTGWDSSAGSQNTQITCSSSPCFIMGNSDVLRGLDINTGSFGSGTCIDLTTNPASGNLFLDLNMNNCARAVYIAPSVCCAQNNRFYNITFWGPEAGSPAFECGANCRFNQVADWESPGVQQGILCNVGCVNNQFTHTRAEDNNSNYVVYGSDDIMTALNNSQIICVHISGSNQIIFSARCSGPVGLSPAIVWNDESAAMSNVIIRDLAVLYNTTYDNTNNGSGSISCSNCILDYVGYPADAATAAYDNTTTEASLDWQRPLKTNYLQAVSSTLTGATFAAPDPQFSPNAHFALTSACTTGSTSCTVPNPVYVHDGQRGTYEVQQGDSISHTIIWSSGYTVTSGAVLDSTVGATTFYPYTVFGTQTILANSFTSGPPVNLVSGGDNFTGWTASGGTITQGQTDPNSGTTAAKLVEDGSTGGHTASIGITIPDNGTYTCAFYFKALGTGSARGSLIEAIGSTGSVYSFTNTSFVITNTGSGGTSPTPSPSVVTEAGGWYRYIISITTAGAGVGSMIVGLANSSGTTYTGDNTSGLFIWRPTCTTGGSPYPP
jgi:hypothetical protein